MMTNSMVANLLARRAAPLSSLHMADAPPHSHLIDFPEALQVLVSRMGELKVVLGPAAAPGVDRLEQELRAGLAARERGDVGTAVGKISHARELLAGLAGAADPAEGAMMRAMAEQFKQALARGALGDAKATADVMRERSGSVVRPKKPV
jgi:hypothetical protein